MRSVACLALLAVWAFGVAAEDTPAQVNVEMRIYRISAPILDATPSDAAEHDKATNDASSVVRREPLHESIGEVALVMDGASLTWNGGEKPDDPGIEVISQPSITVLDGETGNIAIGQDPGPQYMERREDGLFELKQDPHEVGVRISVTPRLAGDAGQANLDLDFESTWIIDREPIPGTTLNMGKPKFQSFPIRLRNIPFPLGDWTCLRSDLPEGGKIYVFTRVSLVSK